MYRILKKCHWLVLQVIMSFSFTYIFVYGNTLITNYIDFITTGQGDNSNFNLKILLFIVIFGTIFAFLKSIFASKFSLEVTKIYKKDLLDKLLKLKMKNYDDMNSGTLVNKVINDFSIIEDFLKYVIPVSIEIAFNFILIEYTIFKLDFILGIFVIIGCLILIGSLSLTNKKIYELSRIRGKLYDSLLSTSSDSLNGIETLRTYNLFSYINKKFYKNIEGIFENEYYRTKASTLAWVQTILVEWLPSLFTILYTVISYSNNKITIGDVTYIVLIVGRLFKFVSEVPFIAKDASITLASYKRVKSIFEMEEETFNKGNTFKIIDKNKALNIHNLSFSYNDTDILLKDIDINIDKYENIAFVGNSGSGKTTIFNLICGYYENTIGDIKIFGNNYKDLSLSEIRKQISIVSQDVYLFKGTILENISYSKLNATKEEIINAAKKANIHDTIMELPNGYETVLSENGVGLSGGERQRVSIARAFLRESQILLLDEPTSALDVKTESLVKDALDKFKGEKTIITIAHRLQTIINADRIYVFSKGEIVEVGNHEELMDKKGHYFKLQSLEESEVH